MPLVYCLNAIPISSKYLDQNKSTLLIGHHLLEGKITNIAKPLAVLLRSKTASHVTLSAGEIPQDENDEDEILLHHGQEGQQPISTADVEWNMIALIKRKIVFSKRPMPVVNLNAHAA